ncbi:MAG: ATP-dependent DNA ligase [Acidimicrobiales bacterium]|nr:ATP-dependent DNA ligase [Acidimicrobiales bacterium]
MRFAEVVATSAAVGATSARTAKRDAIAGLLARLEPEEVAATVGFLTGEPRQGSIGVGWNTIAKLPTVRAAMAQSDHVAADRHGEPPAGAPAGSVLEITDVDRTLTELAGTTGPGSSGRRQELLADLFGRALDDEVRFLANLLTGQLRQGALAGVMADAVARAAQVPAALVRRASMLSGRLDETAVVALGEGRPGLESIGLEPGRPIQPMLASTSPSVAEAVSDLGLSSVEWKLDGWRIQVHRVDDDVRVYTRSLNEMTARVPGVVDVVRRMPARRLVLDGEALVLGDDGRPALFQDSASSDHEARLRPFFFDVLHHDGQDLLDQPLAVRRELLEALVPGSALVPARTTSEPEEADAVLAESLGAGHEGVVVKSILSRYDAGRRGKAWRKVKPVHTLDLVVLAVEWGSGRRTGWLSNLHLGARSGDGGFVMVGKTFKGLTDDLLRWQTERFGELAEREERWSDREQTGVVWVRPEQVVEIAIDGVQRSTRYPGGVALRFARVVRYRPDKRAAEADTIETVRSLLAG